MITIIPSSDSSIVDWELELYQYEPGRFGGLSKEFLYAPRIDDKLCSWAALEALIEASKDSDTVGTISMCGLFDNEEVGSKLRQGAMGNLMGLLNKLCFMKYTYWFLDGCIKRILEASSEDGTVSAVG